MKTRYVGQCPDCGRMIEAEFDITQPAGMHTGVISPPQIGVLCSCMSRPREVPLIYQGPKP